MAGNSQTHAPRGPSAVLFCALVAVTFIGPLSIHMFLPALPFIKQAFMVGSGTAQLAFSLAMFAMAFGTLAYGSLSDRIGRLPTLISGLALFSGGAALAGFAPSIEVMLLGRALQGFGAACGVVLARTIVRDVYGEANLGQMIAYLTTAYVVGPMVAPVIGGTLTDGFGWQSILIVPAVFGFIAIAISVVAIGETRSGTPRSEVSMLRGFTVLLSRRRFLFYALNPGFGTAIFMALNAGATYLMAEVLNRPATEYGLYFILGPLGFMVGNFLAGKLNNRFSAHSLIVAGSIIAFLGATLIASSYVGLPLSPLSLFIPAFTMSIGQGLSMPHAQAAAMSTDASLTGTASGIVVFGQFLLGAALTQLVAMLYDGTPLPMVIIVIAGAALSSAFGILAVLHDRKTAA